MHTTTDVPLMPGPLAWHFNEQMCIISHKPNQCDICNQWTLHYVRDSLNNNLSLNQVEMEHNEDILENLFTEWDTLQKEIPQLQQQLNSSTAPALQSNQV
jgi:hypothetical protein